MDDKKKEQVIAQLENIEAISDFFKDWWSVADLYESTAKVCGILMHVMENANISSDEKKDVRNFIEQHLMMIDLIKPFEKKEDEV